MNGSFHFISLKKNIFEKNEFSGENESKALPTHVFPLINKDNF
jgi:hypothetical protein